MGIGYTICPEALIRNELEDGSLKRIAWDEELFETFIIMIWHVEKWCSLRRAFAFFSGVPKVVVPDNLKSGVKKACYYEPDINPTYLDMANL
jgi:hypothetical protein